ncbi:uncharacterized protein LOC109846139 [Asparagus officinalis]|uniref:uncharacterized protein LOC109846139 n=1 Tax=Asparagus officinalis TaxID=4686 RepID=UPI00098DE2A3|nr:uncharacterized protein LOC109846139 [Asparagus officinalis]
MDTPTILSRDTTMVEDENKYIALDLDGDDYGLLSTTSFFSQASEHEQNVDEPIGVENGEDKPIATKGRPTQATRIKSGIEIAQEKSIKNKDFVDFMKNVTGGDRER